MIYIKSTLVGIVTALLATILYIFFAIKTLMRKYPPPPGGEVGFDLATFLSRPSFWFIALAAFAIAFYWMFRRST